MQLAPLCQDLTWGVAAALTSVHSHHIQSPMASSRNILIALLAAAGIGLLFTARARAAQAAAAQSSAVSTSVALSGPQPDDHEALEKAMEGLKKNLKALSMTVADPARNADSLKSLHAMQEIVLAGKLLTPVHASQVPEKDRAAFQTEYRRDMLKALVELAQAEMELLEGKNEAAKKRIAESIVTHRDASHAKYDPE